MLVAVPVEMTNGVVRTGEERQVVAGLSILGYNVTPNGQRFLLRLRSQQAASKPLTVVQNWTAALK